MPAKKIKSKKNKSKSNTNTSSNKKLIYFLIVIAVVLVIGYFILNVVLEDLFSAPRGGGRSSGRDAGGQAEAGGRGPGDARTTTTTTTTSDSRSPTLRQDAQPLLNDGVENLQQGNCWDHCPCGDDRPDLCTRICSVQAPGSKAPRASASQFVALLQAQQDEENTVDCSETNDECDSDICRSDGLLHLCQDSDGDGFLDLGNTGVCFEGCTLGQPGCNTGIIQPCEIIQTCGFNQQCPPYTCTNSCTGLPVDCPDEAECPIVEVAVDCIIGSCPFENYCINSCTEQTVECPTEETTCTNECTQTTCKDDKNLRLCLNTEDPNKCNKIKEITCGANQVCDASAGACVDESGCTDECIQTQCVGSKLKKCLNTDNPDVCNVLEEITCSVDEVCSESEEACVERPPTCFDDCSFSGKRCSANKRAIEECVTQNDGCKDLITNSCQGGISCGIYEGEPACSIICPPLSGVTCQNKCDGDNLLRCVSDGLCGYNHVPQSCPSGQVCIQDSPFSAGSCQPKTIIDQIFNFVTPRGRR